jgi:N-methylhydantoinase B
LRSADVRFKGQSWDIEIDFSGTEIDSGSVATLIARFAAEHERVYGVRYQDESPVEIRALRCAVRGHSRDSAVLHVHATSERSESPGTRLADFGATHGTIETPVFPRADIPAGGIAGPCLVDEYDTTVVVPPGWDVRRDARDILTLTVSAVDGGARQDDMAYADTIMQEIVGNALASIADEMATTIFRTAHSTIVRDVMDFSAALCDATGETVAQAVTLPLHLGAIPTAMRALLERYGGRMQNGDIFLMNDPFSGGMHTPDLFIVKPVFFDRSLVGYAVTVAHHADVGGRLPGTTACDNTDIFQEGLRLPWVKLYRAGKPVEDIIGLIRTNVRIPNMTMGDINAQIAACTIAERALWDLSVRYGTKRLAALMVRLVDHTETIVRGEIAAWPKGTVSFVDYLDSDGLETRDVRIEVELTVREDEVIVDFSNSAPMVQGALNATVSYTEASVYQAIMCAVASEIPNTSGAFRPVTVVTKPGTITHVVMPGASTMRGVTGFRVFDAVNGALAQLIPDRIPAAGEGGNTLAIFAGEARDGEPFIYYELVVGTWGALPVKDGNDGLCNPCATAANIPVEVAESEFPIMIERYGFVPDTGGPGRYRGGLAIERVWRTLASATSLQVRSDRQNHSPYGLHGGSDGSRSANLLSDGGAWRAFPPMFSAVVDSGTIFHHKMPGGGGWGDPLERAPQLVADDVADNKVSVESARDQYGVVLYTDGAVDARATDDLRAALAESRNESDFTESHDPR